MELIAKYEIYILEDDPDIKKQKYDILYSLSRESRKALNFVYTEQFNMFMARQRQKEFPDINDRMPYLFVFKEKGEIEKGWSRSNIGYKLMNEMGMFQDIPSNMRACLDLIARQRFSNDVKRVLKGEATPSFFKSPCPIYFRKTDVHLCLEDRFYIFKFYPKLYNIKMRVLAEKRNHSKVIMDRVISGDYDVGQSNIKYEKGKWYLRLCYKIVEPKSAPEKDTVIGVDSGFKQPLVYAVADTPVRGKIGDGDIVTKRRTAHRIQYRKMQAGLSHNGKGSCGHGRKRKLEPLDRLSKAFQNFKHTQNHKWAKELINAAIKNKCGTIRMEDLKGITEDKRDSFLGFNWAYDDLINKIKYKCEKFGINFELVQPAETSQRCSKCGHIAPENRPKDERGWGFFCCVKCGFSTMGEPPRELTNIADYNAAYNISGMHIWRPGAIKK